MTYAEICTRILYESQRGGEAAEQANLNSWNVVEAIMPSVLQEVALRCADDPNKQSLLRRTFTVDMTDGVGELDPSILTARLTGATITVLDDSDEVDAEATEDVTLVPEYYDFIAAKGYEPRLAYWCVKGDTALHYVGPNSETYGEFSNNLEYTGASVPVIPAAADDDVDWPDEVQSDVIDYGAEMLRGMKIVV